MEIMRYPGEPKAPKTYFKDLPANKVDLDMVSLATEIIKRKSGPFSPDEFKDRYALALAQLVQEKSKDKRIVSVPDEQAPSGGNVINLMDALRKSLKEADKPADNTVERLAEKSAEAPAVQPKRKARAK